MDPTFNLMEQILGPVPLVTQLEAGSLSNFKSLCTMLMLQKVWDTSKSMLQYRGYSQYTPLWDNNTLPEIAKFGTFEHWKLRDITLVSQLFLNDVFKSFQQLEEEFHLPQNCFYQYLQLRHAIHAQHTQTPLTHYRQLVLNTILKARVRMGNVSYVYLSLLNSTLHITPLTCESKWEQDVGLEANCQQLALIHFSHSCLVGQGG